MVVNVASKKQKARCRANEASWQAQLRDVITDQDELLSILQLTDHPQLPASYPQQQHFRLRVPRSFVQRMQPGDPCDPLLLQVLPQATALQLTPGFCKDPLQEAETIATPGLLHKFSNRVLLTITGACAIHCRYCFRQHFPYKENTLQQQRLDMALQYIKERPQIHEVILSGGDPLMLKDDFLQQLCERLEAIPHLTTLRIHSRLPIVIPARITPGLHDFFQQGRLHKVLVLHCNHPHEISEEVRSAIYQLRSIEKLTLLNQSVLLSHINNDASTLAQLSHALFSAGIMPYYLHQLDKVQGAQHFAVSLRQAQKIAWQLLRDLPGYLVPKLVYEQPGMPSKLPVMLGACPW